MLFAFRILAGLTLALSLLSLQGCGGSQAAEPQPVALPNFVPVLPAVKARALPVDPQKGYLVKQVKPGVFVITDGTYQSAFVTTGQGVILLDAPASLGSYISKAVAEVTQEPIKQLVYGHSHLDHIAGAQTLVQQVPGLEIIAEDGVAAFLKVKNDPRRPVPTRTFTDHLTLQAGSATIELTKGNWHSDEGDLFVYMPSQKVLMAVDILAPGYVPFMNLDLTMNVYEYLKVFDKVLAYDFDVLIAGHLTYLGDRSDVQVTKDYVTDVYTTVKRIHDGTDQMKVMTQAAEKYTWDNKFALFRTLLDGVADSCAAEIQSRWIDKLAGVDVWARSHCYTALIYARWDD